jgi:hypothetical protein
MKTLLDANSCGILKFLYCPRAWFLDRGAGNDNCPELMISQNAGTAFYTGTQESPVCWTPVCNQFPFFFKIRAAHIQVLYTHIYIRFYRQSWRSALRPASWYLVHLKSFRWSSMLLRRGSRLSNCQYGNNDRYTRIQKKKIYANSVLVCDPANTAHPRSLPFLNSTTKWIINWKIYTKILHQNLTSN